MRRCGHAEGETFEFDLPIAKAEPMRGYGPGKWLECGAPILMHLMRTQRRQYGHWHPMASAHTALAIRQWPCGQRRAVRARERWMPLGGVRLISITGNPAGARPGRPPQIRGCTYPKSYSQAGPVDGSAESSTHEPLAPELLIGGHPGTPYHLLLQGLTARGRSRKEALRRTRRTA